MHRVLSYQTAMRASGSRDIREYVTKRTCVSLILSIAFFTLIAGSVLFAETFQNGLKALGHLNNLWSYKSQQACQESNFLISNENFDQKNNDMSCDEPAWFEASFLLGKFVSDRQYHIKHINEMHTPPPHVHPIDSEFLHYKTAREQLLQTTRFLSEQLKLLHTAPESVNALIFNKYVACVQEGPEKQHEVVEIFVENLLLRQTAKHIECLGILKDYIDSLLTH